MSVVPKTCNRYKINLLYPAGASTQVRWYNREHWDGAMPPGLARTMALYLPLRTLQGHLTGGTIGQNHQMDYTAGNCNFTPYSSSVTSLTGLARGKGSMGHKTIIVPLEILTNVIYVYAFPVRLNEIIMFIG